MNHSPESSFCSKDTNALWGLDFYKVLTCWLSFSTRRALEVRVTRSYVPSSRVCWILHPSEQPFLCWKSVSAPHSYEVIETWNTHQTPNPPQNVWRFLHIFKYFIEKTISNQTCQCSVKILTTQVCISITCHDVHERRLTGTSIASFNSYAHILLRLITLSQSTNMPWRFRSSILTNMFIRFWTFSTLA